MVERAWRYKNLVPEEGPIRNEKQFPQLRAILDIPDEKLRDAVASNNWLFGPDDKVMNIVELRYAYGFPMDSVNEALALRIQITAKMLRHFIAEPDTRKMGRLGITEMSFLLGLVESYLIDRKDLADEILGTLKKAVALSLPWRQGFTKEYLDMVVALMEEPGTDKSTDVWNKYESKKGDITDLHEPVRALIKADGGAFNERVRANVLKEKGSERARSRKKNRLPNHLFDSYYTSLAALALEQGIALTFRDSAVPVWDFPIAQREDVKPLLPPEPK